MIRALLAIILMMISDLCFAIPEAVRYGKASCVSCHVSPGGGGLLTNYGRMFAAERLSTWSYEGEENVLHGLVPPNDYVLVGGDARWVDYRTSSGDVSFQKFWRMQTDLELALHVGPIWFQGMMGTKPAGPNDDPKDSKKLIHRGYSVRADLFDDHLILRAGLFLPKFGLMIADHTAFNRVALGFAPDAEQTQMEATIQSDSWEATIATLLYNEMYDRENKSKSGFNLGISLFMAEKHRVNVGLLQTKQSSKAFENTRTAFSISGVISLTRKIYGLFELDRINQVNESEGASTVTQSFVAYSTLNWEAIKGLIPFFRYEYWNRNLAVSQMSTSRAGGGMTWYPRPHLQLEARVLRTIVQGAPNAKDETGLILHYYF